MRNRGSRRKYKLWAEPIRLLMGEGEIVIEMVREWAEDTRYLRKEQVGRRGPGRPQDKWRKAFIAEVVAHLLDKYPRLDASKNPATAMPTDAKGRKVPENACAIVAEGLRRAGIQVTDKAVAGQLGPL